MHITISALPLARLDGVEFCFQSCRLPDYFIGFTFSLQPCRLPEYQSTTLPLVRLYYIDFSYQPCHLPDYIALFSFYSRAFAKLYLAGFSLQSCHSSDLMALVSSYSRATSQALFHRFQFAVLTLVRLYFMVTVSSSPRVALLSDAKDRPIEEKQPGQGIRGTTRRPDHVRLSACQEGLEGSATAGPPPGNQHPRPFNGGGRTSLDGPAPGQAGLQDPNSGQRGPECTASCSLPNNSAGSPHLEDVEGAVRASMLASVSDSMTSTGPSC